MWESYRKSILNESKADENLMILGIDLGTTHSVISYYNFTNKRPEPIDISQGFGKIPMPSVIQLREEDGEEWVIGEEALRSMKLYPSNTVMSVKRKMGTCENIKIGDKKYLPEELSAKVLTALLNHVTAMNPKSIIAGVVVSVPYDFDDAAKKATINACRLAGLGESLICLIEEPKAAALAYHFQHEFKKNEKIMVFDFGGGTLDITVFQVAKIDAEQINLQVISEGGEALHGGDNIDEMILSRLNEYIEKETGIHSNKLSIENQAELTIISREVKERLSGLKKYRIPFTFCMPPFMKEMTREGFENLIEPFIQKTRQLVLKALSDAYEGALKPSDIDMVLLEGGSSSMPWVKEMMVSIFNDYEKIICSERPALDISIGAAYYAAIKMGLLEHPELMAVGRPIRFEVTVPHDIGFEVDYGNKKSFFTMISRGTPYLLARKSHCFTLMGETPEDMTNLKIKLLERIHKVDEINKCKLIGEVEIKGLPKREAGKTKLKVTLIAQEEGGIIKGVVEDLGSFFKADFSPEREKVTIINASVR